MKTTSTIKYLLFRCLALNIALTFVEKSIHKSNSIELSRVIYKAKYLKGSEQSFELARFRVIWVRVIGVKIAVYT